MEYLIIRGITGLIIIIQLIYYVYHFRCYSSFYRKEIIAKKLTRIYK